MDNSHLASIFKDIARLLEFQGENQFKVRAYANASRVIRDYHEELAEMVKRGDDLREIEGIGDAIALKIGELLSTGRLEFFERTKDAVPDGILALMDLPGIGPKTAARLARERGITTVDQLERELTESSTDHLPGLGTSSAASLLEAIAAQREHDGF